MNDSKKETGKKVSVILNGLLLTIIGSAIWEFFLRDFLKAIPSKVIAFLEPMAAGYLDILYKAASSGFHESSSLTIYQLIFFMLGFYVLIGSVYAFIDSGKVKKSTVEFQQLLSEEDESIQNSIPAPFDDIEYKRNPLTFKERAENAVIEATATFNKARIVFILAIIYLLFSFGVTFHASMVNSIQTTTLANIEIVSPYVSDVEYKQLKSSFYSMECKADFDVINEKITSVAKEYDLRLKN